jgi:hypothetical protein
METVKNKRIYIHDNGDCYCSNHVLSNSLIAAIESLPDFDDDYREIWTPSGTWADLRYGLISDIECETCSLGIGEK